MSSIENDIRVEVSQDGLRAFLITACNDTALSSDRLRELLRDAGVVSGINETMLQAIASGPSDGQPVLVAEGRSPVNGQDGWIEYLFDYQRMKPADEGGGKVDLHDMHYVHNVRKGEKLAVVHPPVIGTPGMTVTGKVIAVTDVKKGTVHAGPHTEFLSDDSLVLCAMSDGSVMLRRDGTVEVLTVITIPGNVDFSTGNIDFIGTLRVMGEIKGDFTVKVEQDLEVFNGVEDAQLEVGGNAIIHKGFTGAGKGKLVAGGNVSVLHVLNQTIVSGKNIVVERESVNGNLKAGSRIIAPSATVAGGLLEADEEVDVQNLGSGENSQARIKVGRKGRLIERLGQVEKELKLLEKQNAEVNDGVYRLIRMKLDKGILPLEKEQLLAKLQGVQRLMPDSIQSLLGEREKLKTDLKLESGARVVVRGAVFENVVIEINGVRTVVENALQDVVFAERAGAIESRPLE